MTPHIIIDPQVCHGKPCIARHRIPVAMVLELIADGISFDEILMRYYPSLTRDDLADCIRYAQHVIEPEPFFETEQMEQAV